MARTTATNRASLKTNYEINSGTIIDDFESGWTRDNDLDTIVLNSQDYFKTGIGAVKFTVGTGKANGSFTKTVDLDLSSSGNFVFWVYIVDLSVITSTTLAFYTSSTTDFSKYFSSAFASQLHEGWNKIIVPRSSMVASGGEVWTDKVIRFRFRCYGDSVHSATFYFDSLLVSEYSRPKLLLTFDDGSDDIFVEAYSYMATKGLVGTAYVPGDALHIGAANYMTVENLHTLNDNGWDIGNHGATHTNLSTLSTQEEMEAEISGGKAFLDSLGLTRASDHFAYPNGGYNATALLAIVAQGVKTARSIISRVQANELDNPHLITRRVVANTNTLAAAQGFVDKLIDGGGSCWLNFHQLVASDADVGAKWLISDFQALMDYIAVKKLQGLLDDVTVSEWYNGLDGRRETATGRVAATIRN